MTWSVERKTVLITGGNAGIGKEAAVALAAQGARVTVTARDEQRGARALAEIKARSGNGAVEMMMLDLASFASVRSFAGVFLDAHDRLDVLVNNAGLVLSDRRETEDGHETTFQVNHLGPFLLTHLLLDRLKGSAPSRVITVSSGGHKQSKGLDFDDLDRRRRPYKGFEAYCDSKLCNVYFARELARRLSGSGVASYSLHPGFVATDFARRGDTKLLAIGIGIARPFALSAKKGARTTVFLASSPEVGGASGDYFARSKPAHTSKRAQDDEAARRLWDAGGQLTGAVTA